MRVLGIIILLLAALGAGYAGSRFGQAEQSAAAKQETTYERVMRTKTLRCGYGLWPGSTDRDPNTGAMSGWVPAVTEELGKKLGLKIEWTAEFMLGQQTELLKSGKVDALCTSDGPWVFGDAAYLDWTHPMAYYPIYLVMRENETRFKTMEDFNKPDVIFSTIDGDTSATLHADLAPKAKRLDVPQSGDLTLLVLNVDTGKADAAFLDDQTIKRVAEKTPIKLRKFSEQPIIVVPASFSLKKGDTELMQMLNQGFDMLKDMGVTAKIFEQQGLKDAAFMPAKSWQPWEK